MNESVWELPFPEYPPLETDRKTDVLVVGGGLAGILCAWQLKKQGIDAVLLEADRICAGVSRRTTAKITSQHGLIYHRLIREFGPEYARLYWKANEWALDQYRILAPSGEFDFEEKESILYCGNGSEALTKEMEALLSIGIPGQWRENTELPFPARGIAFPGQGQFHPMKFVLGLLEGLKIHENSPVLRIDGNRAYTQKHVVTAEKIIVATHFPMINKVGGYFLKLHQQRSYVLALKGAGVYDAMYRCADSRGFSFRNWGDVLLLGGGSARTGEKSGGWEELETFCQKHYPGARVIARWATQDCISLDGVPYIGSYSPRTPDMYVAAGFNKWGMTGAMLASAILADAVQGREHPFGAIFSPDRSILRPQLGENLWHSTKNLLRPTAPRCPHMGCALKWNPRERSWDCPCHGSRFTQEGKLLENPAKKDLEA